MPFANSRQQQKASSKAASKRPGWANQSHEGEKAPNRSGQGGGDQAASGGRWSKLDDDENRGGFRSHKPFNSGNPRRNKRGFYGDMRQDRDPERQLFGDRSLDYTSSKRGIDGNNFDSYAECSVETSGNDVPAPMNAFDVKNVGKDIFRIVQLCGYTTPTPIQKYGIPCGKAGRDLMACAQTGSGKTAGYLIPVIHSMIEKGGSGPFPKSPRRCIYPEALILSPTRELASQIDQEASKFTYRTGIAPAVVYGGYEVRIEQLRRIERGCDLLVATPGRLLDLIERGRISLDNVHYLILDEADQMLDMGFEPQIRRIIEAEGMPSGSTRQTMMFSATFPSNIQRIANDFLRNYIFLSIGHVGSASADVTQVVEYAEKSERIDKLMRYLLSIEEGLIIVFVETKHSCDFIEDVLSTKGFPACSIHGDKTQGEREEALRSFKSGASPVLVATSVASRGLDIPNVTHVVNFQMTSCIDSYVHRIGRTGRAGHVGTALTYIDEGDFNIVGQLRDFLKDNDQKVPAWLEEMVVSGNRRRGARNKARRTENNVGGATYQSTAHHRPGFAHTNLGPRKGGLMLNNAEAGGHGKGGLLLNKAKSGKRNLLGPGEEDFDLLAGRHIHWGSVTSKKSKPPESKHRGSEGEAPALDAGLLLALPGEDEAAAAARIERRRQKDEERKFAEKKKAMEAALVAAEEARKQSERAAKAAAAESTILDGFVSGKWLGPALTQWCIEQKSLLPSVEKLVFHLLLTKEKDSPDGECEWASPPKYGDAILSLVGENMDGQVQVLWAIQEYCHRLGFPKLENGEYLIQAMFRAMYKYDLAEEEAFSAWKEDESNEHWPGKSKAIIQTVAWFGWLEEDDEGADEETDEEEDCDMQGTEGNSVACLHEENMLSATLLRGSRLQGRLMV